jgi:hypothetical protein
VKRHPQPQGPLAKRIAARNPPEPEKPKQAAWLARLTAKEMLPFGN